jgi:hypothetical protein
MSNVCIMSTERTEMDVCPTLTSCNNVTACHANTDCEDNSTCCRSNHCGTVCTRLSLEDRPPSSEYHSTIWCLYLQGWSEKVQWWRRRELQIPVGWVCVGMEVRVSNSWSSLPCWLSVRRNGSGGVQQLVLTPCWLSVKPRTTAMISPFTKFRFKLICLAFWVPLLMHYVLIVVWFSLWSVLREFHSLHTLQLFSLCDQILFWRFRSFRHLPAKNIVLRCVVLCCVMVTGLGLKFQRVSTCVTSLTRWRGRVKEWGWLCPHQCATWMDLLRQLNAPRGRAGVWIRLELRFRTQGKYFPRNIHETFCRVMGFSTFPEL